MFAITDDNGLPIYRTDQFAINLLVHFAIEGEDGTLHKTAETILRLPIADY